MENLEYQLNCCDSIAIVSKPPEEAGRKKTKNENFPINNSMNGYECNWNEQ